MTPELQTALDSLAQRRGEERDRMVEIFLREHPLIQREVTSVRAGERADRPRNGVARHEVTA